MISDCCPSQTTYQHFVRAVVHGALTRRDFQFFQRVTCGLYPHSSESPSVTNHEAVAETSKTPRRTRMMSRIEMPAGDSSSFAGRLGAAEDAG